jgi:hypothetical protein
MARARNIKPGFCRNEDLAECSVWARLCFALLPMLADREGRLEDRPKKIKGDLFPFDSVEVEPLLVELERWQMIARYTVNGLGLIQILGFRKHQNPHHREPESTLPPHPSLRLDGDGKYVKPEALDSSHEPKASGKPEASPRLDPPRVDLPRGSNPADSGFLIPDSGEIPSEAIASAAAAPPAPPPLSAKERVWLLGPQLLGEKGKAFIGKLVSTYGEDTVADVLAAAIREEPGEPKSWVAAACEARGKARPPDRNGHQQEQLDLTANPKPEWAIKAGFPNRFEAENAGCKERTAHLFRNGQRIAA